MRNVSMNRTVCLLVFLLASGPVIGQGELRCGSYVDGVIATAEQDYWIFEGEAGDLVSLVLVNINSNGGWFSPRIQLFKPTDRRVPFIADISPGAIEIGLPETGVYLLEVHDSDFVTWSTGGYRIGLDWMSPIEKQCDTRDVLCGERFGETIWTAKQRWYHFEGVEDELLTLHLITTDTNGGWFDGQGFLYGPDLTSGPIEGPFWGPDIPLLLPETDVYTLRIIDSDHTLYSAGSYLLNLTRDDPPCDCNANGTADDADITSGASRDDDDNRVPDECETPARVWVEQVEEENCVRVMAELDVRAPGGELRFRYDATLIANLRAEAGASLPGSPVVTDDDGADVSTCSADPGVDAGFTVSWINSTSAAPPSTAVGTREILKICYDTLGAPGSCSPIQFDDCVGAGAGTPRNIVVDEDGASREVLTLDGEACVELVATTFRRSDANGDGFYDMGDPITILLCLFVQRSCLQVCDDARDANDDGEVNVTDAIDLINWRFNGGDEPPPPFSGCGDDPTPDELDCVASELCQ